MQSPMDPFASHSKQTGREDICAYQLASLSCVHERTASRAPYTDLPICKTLLIRGETFDIASDWHLPTSEVVIPPVLRGIEKTGQAGMFICAGDVFDARNGEDTSFYVSKLLNGLAKLYDLVLYVPGNHCLRSRANPWSSFTLADNVIMPVGDEPKIINTPENRILLGNVFYDLQFLDSSFLGISESDLRAFYASTTDGRYLLNGNLDDFRNMTASVASLLTSDITLLVSHALPHYAPLRFRTEIWTDAIKEQVKKLGILDCSDDEKLQGAAEHWGCSVSQALALWNTKCFLMGSNILNHPEASPRDGLTAIYGHNHRASEMHIKARNGSSIKLVSHQPYGGLPQNWIDYCLRAETTERNTDL